jgi:hypothetical protein
MRVALLLAGALAATMPAQAAVRSASPGGFEVESKVVVPAKPNDAYLVLGRIGEWWSPDHTYSHLSANLTLDLRPGGCFCERLPAGGVEHGRVLLAWPGRILRIQGALGPLQSEGVTGTLTWALAPVPEGTEITQTYKVGGYFPTGTDKLAPVVDQVLAEQLGRVKARLSH